MEFVLTFLELSDIYKDCLYVFFFPHSSIWVTGCLAMSICAPVTTLWIQHGNLRIAVLYFLGIQNLFPSIIDQKMKADEQIKEKVFEILEKQFEQETGERVGISSYYKGSDLYNYMKANQEKGFEVILEVLRAKDRKTALYIVAIGENLVQMSLFYFDVFNLGNRLVAH